jgi:erythromycin esterase-like protein
MAENIQWIAHDFGRDARVVLWAHYDHVALTGRALGSLLRRAIGSDAVVIGSAVGRGSFLALPPRGGEPSIGPQVYSVGPAPPESLESVLAATGIPVFIVDLRRARASTAAWFAEVRPMRIFGARVHELSPLYRIIPAREFDAVSFVAEITPTHLLAARR